MREIDLVDPSINIGRLIGCDFSQEVHRPANIPNPEGEAEFKSRILGRMHHAKNRHNPHDQCHTGNIPLREMTVLAPANGK